MKSVGIGRYDFGSPWWHSWKLVNAIILGGYDDLENDKDTIIY